MTIWVNHDGPQNCVYGKEILEKVLLSFKLVKIGWNEKYNVFWQQRFMDFDNLFAESFVIFVNILPKCQNMLKCQFKAINLRKRYT